jgi:hypothetical protein
LDGCALATARNARGHGHGLTRTAFGAADLEALAPSERIDGFAQSVGLPATVGEHREHAAERGQDEPPHEEQPAERAVRAFTGRQGDRARRGRPRVECSDDGVALGDRNRHRRVRERERAEIVRADAVEIRRPVALLELDADDGVRREARSPDDDLVTAPERGGRRVVRVERVACRRCGGIRRQADAADTDQRDEETHRKDAAQTHHDHRPTAGDMFKLCGAGRALPLAP